MKSSLFYDIGSKGVQHFFELFVLCMDIQVDRLGQIQTENTHDGFCVNDITAGDEIEIKIETVNIIYKSLDFIDGIQRNFNCLLVTVHGLCVRELTHFARYGPGVKSQIQ